MASIEVKGRQVPGTNKVLSKEALAFVADLQRRFGGRRKELLAARAERDKKISRSQLWLWGQGKAQLDDGRSLDKALYEKLRAEEMKKLVGDHLEQAASILDKLVGDFPDFLTLPAYELLD